MGHGGSIYGEPIVWRDTIRSPRLLIFDARLIFCCALLIVHLRVWTALILLVGIVIFWLIERAGLRFPSALRALRSKIAGAARPAMPGSLYRGSITTAFENHPLLSAQRRRKASMKKDTAVKSRKVRGSDSGSPAPEPSLAPAE